jgi:hypothetical protein
MALPTQMRCDWRQEGWSSGGRRVGSSGRAGTRCVETPFTPVPPVNPRTLFLAGAARRMASVADRRTTPSAGPMPRGLPALPRRRDGTGEVPLGIPELQEALDRAPSASTEATWKRRLRRRWRPADETSPQVRLSGDPCESFECAPRQRPSGMPRSCRPASDGHSDGHGQPAMGGPPRGHSAGRATKSPIRPPAMASTQGRLWPRRRPPRGHRGAHAAHLRRTRPSPRGNHRRGGQRAGSRDLGPRQPAHVRHMRPLRGWKRRLHPQLKTPEPPAEVPAPRS